MGQKAAIVLCGCNMLSMFIWFYCMFSTTWMDKTFYPPGGSLVGVKAMHVKAGLIGVTYEPPFFCARTGLTSWMREKMGETGEKMCATLEAEKDFHGMQDAFCEDKVREIIFPTACFSVKMLMWSSRLMFMLLVFTVIMQITASFFVAYYFTKSAKGRYRQVATILLLTAPSMDFLGLCMYTYAATVFCDMFRECRIPMIFSSEGSGLGNVHWAWIWAFMNCTCMFIFPFIVHNLKTKSERLQKEARMQAEFEAEMSRYGMDNGYGGDQYGGYQDPYSQQQYDPYSQQPQPGYDPYSQQQGYGQAAGYGSQPGYNGAYGY